MREPTSFRGQPLLVLAGVLCAWIGIRVAVWQSTLDQPGPKATASSAGMRAQAPIDEAEVVPEAAAGMRVGSNLPPTPGSGHATWAEALPSRPVLRRPHASTRSIGELWPKEGSVVADMAHGRGRLAFGHNLLLVAGLSQVELPPEFTAHVRGAAAARPGIPAAAPQMAGLPPPLPGESRLSADAWLMVRQDTPFAVAAGRPSYGRSQTGVVLRYRLEPSSRHGLQAFVRASTALQGPLERDIAAGISARPVPQIPLRLAAEARVTETEGHSEVRPAVIAATEAAPVGLPAGFRVEAYVQGGYVAGRFATGFVDGQGRLERPVARVGDAELAAGAGIWGGAQKGAARLDVGPTAAFAFRLGGARGRVAADYRVRLAGNAEPSSGPTVTLSAGF